MLSLFKRNPIEKLEKQYYKKLEDAMHAQRNGDIKSYSMMTAEAEEIKVSIDALRLEHDAQTDK